MVHRVGKFSVGAALAAGMLALAACSSSTSSDTASSPAASEAAQSAAASSPAASPATSEAASTASDTVAVDVGTGTPVEMSTGKLKVGIFMNAQSNQWQQNVAEQMQASAEANGWDAEVLDFNFDQSAMTNALQQAATNHAYDAIAIVPIDSVGSCKMLTETLPQANILVVVAGSPICGLDLKSGDEMWAPGTYSYNQVAPTFDYAQKFYENTAAMFPGPQKVAVVVGPEAQGNTIIMRSLAKDMAKSNPDFEIVDFINTDYTTPTTFSAVQSYLQAHKDTTLVMSVYSPDISRGVVQALESLDLAGKVNVTDMGGPQYSVDEINKGNIQMTMPYYPKTMAENMIASIKEAQSGATPTRVNDEIPGGVANAPTITKDNVASYVPQF